MVEILFFYSKSIIKAFVYKNEAFVYIIKIFVYINAT